MNKTIIALGLAMTLSMGSGCVHTYWNESSALVPMENGTTNMVSTVRVGQYAFWTKSDLQNFSFANDNRHIGVEKYSTTGDVALMESTTKLVVYALSAYASMGSVPAIEAIMEAFKQGEVDRVVSKYKSGQPITKEDFPVASSFKPTMIKK